jgi:lysophospholipid acyltransferase (LPLAT)-like uncharacterized protein
VSTPAPIVGEAEAQAPPRFSLRQRFLLWLITWAAWLVVRLIAPTLRYTVSREEGAPADEFAAPAVWSFWHRCLIPAAWHWRRRRIAVMTSQSFDGEYIARIIEKFGFRAVRGSSSRGGVRALLGMHTELEAGRAVAFTIDGPRGPRYLAKPGPVLLAKKTGLPLQTFHIALENPWVLDSWDAFMVPKPFSRALIRIGRLIPVPADADEAAMSRCHAELQQALDRIREFAETNL